MYRAIASLFVFLVLALPVNAEMGIELGEQEFLENCAVCHGASASGNGPVSRFLRIEPSDLTKLARDNGGEFPFERVYQVIDGRTEVALHGPRKMPVWGYKYLKDWKKNTDPTRQEVPAEHFVTGRILSLIRYIQTLQTD